MQKYRTWAWWRNLADLSNAIVFNVFFLLHSNSISSCFPFVTLCRCLELDTQRPNIFSSVIRNEKKSDLLFNFSLFWNDYINSFRLFNARASSWSPSPLDIMQASILASTSQSQQILLRNAGLSTENGVLDATASLTLWESPWNVLSKGYSPNGKG